MQQTHISRRALLGGAAAFLARPASAKARLKVAIFSKHLQFVQGPDLAQAAADLGFDSVDITVRKAAMSRPNALPASFLRWLPKFASAVSTSP